MASRGRRVGRRSRPLPRCGDGEGERRPGHWTAEAGARPDRPRDRGTARPDEQSMTAEERHDVVVIGGGPAGVSCALECFDIKLDVVLLESGGALGGQLPEIPHAVRNVAIGGFESGPRLQDSMADAAALLGDRVRLSHAVTAVDLGTLAVDAAGTRLRAEAIVIATGAARRELAVAPDGAFGGDVSYLIEARPGWFSGRD